MALNHFFSESFLARFVQEFRIDPKKQPAQNQPSENPTPHVGFFRQPAAALELPRVQSEGRPCTLSVAAAHQSPGGDQQRSKTSNAWHTAFVTMPTSSKSGQRSPESREEPRQKTDRCVTFPADLRIKYQAPDTQSSAGAAPFSEARCDSEARENQDLTTIRPWRRIGGHVAVLR